MAFSAAAAAVAVGETTGEKEGESWIGCQSLHGVVAAAAVPTAEASVVSAAAAASSSLT